MNQVQTSLRLRDVSNSSWRYRIVVIFCIFLARGVSRLPPQKIATFLRFLKKGARPASYEEASTFRNDVMALSSICAGEGCLERSISTAIVCRIKKGCFPDWVTGVRVQPFRAHAWVEVDGVPVDESIGAEYAKMLSVSIRNVEVT